MNGISNIVLLLQEEEDLVQQSESEDDEYDGLESQTKRAQKKAAKVHTLCFPVLVCVPVGTVDPGV